MEGKNEKVNENEFAENKAATHMGEKPKANGFVLVYLFFYPVLRCRRDPEL